jgi:hypothetical protein
MLARVELQKASDFGVLGNIHKATTGAPGMTPSIRLVATGLLMLLAAPKASDPKKIARIQILLCTG